MSFADKDRELGEAQAQIRALKLSERAREKAVEEVIFTIFCSTVFSKFKKKILVYNFIKILASGFLAWASTSIGFCVSSFFC